MFTKYGYTTIGITVIIVFLIIAASIIVQNNYIKYPLLIFGIIILGLTLNFFRDPDRIPPALENVIVAPADGRVLIVKSVNADRYLNDEAWQISIFMSPFDVHVNRIPISGSIEYLEYHSGDYLVAYHDKADKRNERSEIGILSKYGKVLFTQVAGFVARRIIYEIGIGENVKIGERFGMIKFGSRVDVVVSKEWEVKIKEGDRVTAGESILYEFNK
jgi:phosphatidylserine decarboxylase